MPASASHPPVSGYTRFCFDIAAEDHARFKAICALHQTTMSHEVNCLIAAQLADPDRLLSEALYVRVSLELKQELLDYAVQRRVGLGTLLMEAMAWWQRQQEPLEPALKGHQPPRPRHRVERTVAGRGRAR
jgi:hypothetical protein